MKCIKNIVSPAIGVIIDITKYNTVNDLVSDFVNTDGFADIFSEMKIPSGTVRDYISKEWSKAKVTNTLLFPIKMEVNSEIIKDDTGYQVETIVLGGESFNFSTAPTPLKVYVFDTNNFK